MSDNSFEDFLRAVMARSDLQEQLKTEIDQRGVESSYELADLAVEIGTERGFDFTHRTARISIDDLIAAGQQNAGLGDERSDGAAGGSEHPEHGGKTAADQPISLEVSQSFRLDKMKIGK